MKYLPLKDIDIVNNAINFSTPELHVIGSCDIYTTKAAGGDKKLYRYIEDTLESRYQTLVRLSASLSPPAPLETNSEKQNDGNRRKRSRTAEMPEIDLSRDSPFGSLSGISARRTFAYLIATLNAAHPDYDFSHVLRPKDFKKERSLRTLMNNVDTTLDNLRPKHKLATQLMALPSSHSSMVAANNDVWSPHMWDLLDQEMNLQECERYSYAPSSDPFDGEEGALWSMHYFFFNKERKRVCYFYLRALSVMSHSPIWKQPILRRKTSTMASGAGKRASYWLGEKASGADSYAYGDDDEEMEEWYPESSDDEDVDRIRYTDLDQIREDLVNGHWEYDETTQYTARGPGSVTDEIGEAMDI